MAGWLWHFKAWQSGQNGIVIRIVIHGTCMHIYAQNYRCDTPTYSSLLSSFLSLWHRTTRNVPCASICWLSTPRPYLQLCTSILKYMLYICTCIIYIYLFKVISTRNKHIYICIYLYIQMHVHIYIYICISSWYYTLICSFAFPAVSSWGGCADLARIFMSCNKVWRTAGGRVIAVAVVWWFHRGYETVNLCKYGV
jgi:hypothetical protein